MNERSIYRAYSNGRVCRAIVKRELYDLPIYLPTYLLSTIYLPIYLSTYLSTLDDSFKLRRTVYAEGLV